MHRSTGRRDEAQQGKLLTIELFHITRNTVYAQRNQVGTLTRHESVSITHSFGSFLNFQKLQEQLTKRSESLGRDAVYTRTVSYRCFTSNRRSKLICELNFVSVSNQSFAGVFDGELCAFPIQRQRGHQRKGAEGH